VLPSLVPRLFPPPSYKQSNAGGRNSLGIRLVVTLVADNYEVNGCEWFILALRLMELKLALKIMEVKLAHQCFTIIYRS